MRHSFRTPGGVFLATLAGAVLLSACQSQVDQGQGSEGQCALEPMPISTIQGEGRHSEFQGRDVNIRGVVTQLGPDGLYVQSLAPDDNPATSEGLFIAFGQNMPRIEPGQLLAAGGLVSERGDGKDTMTSLESVSAWAICSADVPLPLTDARLPMDDQSRESIEAMRVNLAQAIVVTDVYALRFGDIRISADQILPSPTEVARPGSDARDQSRQNQHHSMRLGLMLDDEPTFPVGTRLGELTGVMAADERGPQLTLEKPLEYFDPPLFPVPPPGKGDLRVVSLNLLNYFNGDGSGKEFPTPRGAETPQEFEQQRHHLRAAIAKIQPAIIGVMELENDGFGIRSAAADFLEDLNQAVEGDWQAVGSDLGAIGSDQIKVGLFYRADLVQTSGPPAVLGTQPFQRGSRVPLAQVFIDPKSGERFLVVVNHLKSKGSCPDSGANANQRDGQGCWNPARTEAARSMTRWTKKLADEHADGRALIIGDLNAYRMEDPVQAIIEEGFHDLTAPSGLMFEYSYVFRGEAGTLDYALASPALNGAVRRAQILNINAGFPPGVQQQYDWLRSSDHDPVIVDVRFRHP